MSDKNPIRTQVVSGLILAGVISLLSLIPGGWAFAWAMVCEMWKMCAAWLHEGHMIKGWLLGLLIVCAIFAIVTCGMIAKAWLMHSADSPLGWKTYTCDSFDGLKWRWRYSANTIPMGISCHCPRCDQQVYHENRSARWGISRIGFRCDNCDSELGEFDLSYDSLEDKTLRSIQRKLRNDEWRQVVEKNTSG